MVQSVAPARSEIVLLSGHDLRRLLNPKVVIEALREAYAALADHAFYLKGTDWLGKRDQHEERNQPEYHCRL